MRAKKTDKSGEIMKNTLVAIIVIIALCCGAYFAWQWYDAQKTPPAPHNVNEFDQAIYDSLVAVGVEDELLLADLTVENAVDAIKQINKNQDYYAVFTVERFSGDAEHITESTVWKNGERYRAEISGDDSRVIISDGSRVKITNNQRGTSNILENGGDFTCESQIGAVDISYFLDNADNELISASFARTVGRTGGNIIYVEFYYPDFDQLERFYISADYGVVLAAETYTADELTYRLTTQRLTPDYTSDETIFDITD